MMINERGLSTRIEIDGGIDVDNIAKVVEAGAEIIVAGSAVYGKVMLPKQSVDLISAASVWV